MNAEVQVVSFIERQREIVKRLYLAQIIAIARVRHWSTVCRRKIICSYPQPCQFLTNITVVSRLTICMCVYSWG